MEIELWFDLDDGKLLVTSNTINRKGHWVRKKLTDFWLPRVEQALRARGVEPFESPAAIAFGFRFPNNRIRDSHNLSPVAKAAIDGIVAAGVLPGDDDRHVGRVSYERIWPNGPHAVRIGISNCDPPQRPRVDGGSNS